MDLQSKIISRELLQALYDNGKTIGTAESCTGGRLAQTIIAAPGASVEANQISSENTRFCNSTSALCVSTQPSFGFKMLTFTCLIFVSMIIIYAIV